MFWKVRDKQGNYLAPLTDVVDPVLTQELGKVDVLIFGISAGLGLEVEQVIETDTDAYRIKGADGRSIEAVQDLQALESKGYGTFLQKTQPISTVVSAALGGTGWTAEIDASVPAISRTLDLSETNALAVLQEASKIYGAELWFNAKLKKVYYKAQRGVDRGAYFVSGLNLEEFEIVTDTYGLYTRLYAKGKDGMTFADINGGKDYVENFTYTSTVISRYMSDERYTIPESLLEKALEMVGKGGVPRTTYRLKVADLSNVPGHEFLSYGVGDTVTIKDEKTRTADKQRVVAHKKNPVTGRGTDISMANAIVRYTSRADKLFEEALAEISAKIGTVRGATIDYVTDLLTGALGGYIKQIDGEMFITDHEDPNLATRVWRWNINGLGYSGTGINGPYETAMTMDGVIVGKFISANSISVNQLKSDVGQSLDLSSNTSIKLKVGGRNYVYDSERELSYAIARTEAVHVEHLRDGDVLTVSFQGKADNVDHIVDVYFRDAVNGGIINRSPDFNLTSEFQRFAYTTTLQDVSAFPNGMELVIRGSTGADASNAGKTFTIKESKVERGNHVTDWTPATEDIQAQIEITNDAIESSVRDINGEISTIKQTTDAIESSVSDLDGDISTVRQTTEDLTLSFETQQIGGENLLRGSDKIVVGDMYAVVGSEAEYQSQTIGDTFKENVPDGSLVTISFDVETLTGIDRLQVYNNNNAGPQGIETRSISNVPVGKSRQYVKTVVFHRAEADINRVGNFIEFYSTYGSNQFYKISRIKIELGNVPTDYSLHPEELYVGITKANKDGISVGRSDETIESVLQYDGLKIMEGQRLIASFNSSGANVPELIAKRIRGDVLNLTDGSQTITVGDGKDFGTVTEALDSFGNAKNLSDSTTITIEVHGDIYDTIRVMGWTGGGQIIIHFMTDARLNGVFRSYGNDCRVTVRGASSTAYGTIKRAGSLSHPVYSLGDKYLRFYYMNLDGEGASASGFYINEGSMAFIYECDIVNVDHALRVVNGGSLVAYSNRGACSRYGARSEKGGRMWLKGTVPDGEQGSTSIWDGFRISEGTITTAQSLYQAPLTQPVRFSTIIRPTRIYTTGYGQTWVATYYGNTGAQGRWETMTEAMVANFDFSDAVYKYHAGGTSPTIEMRFRRTSSYHGQSAGVAPRPYNFTPSGTFNAVPKGSWTNWVSMPLGVFPSTGTTLKLYSSAVNTGYAIWDACEVRVGVTREV